MSEKRTWSEGMESDSFTFRLSKEFGEFEIKVTIEHKVLESGETVTDIMTGQGFHCCRLTWKSGEKVDMHELAKAFIADYFKGYHVLSDNNEWIPTDSWKKDIDWPYQK